MQNLAETMREQRVGPFEFTSSTADLYEECCSEGCSTGEMAENVHPIGYSDRAQVRILKQKYLCYIVPSAINGYGA